MAAPSVRPRIGLIGCGGTIGSLADDPLDVVDYPDSGRKIGVEELLAHVPETARLADVSARDFRAVSSSAFGPREWLGLRRMIEELAATGVEGIVVTHGTGSLEETAFFLHLTLALSIPVVVTGAQRPLSAVGSDGPANLLAAIRVAACTAARDLGILVVLNDEVHTASDVVKSSTYRLQTFQSPDAGPLGHVDGGAVILRRTPVHRGGAFTAHVARQAIDSLPAVHIVYSYAGADGAPIRAAVAGGARGIVSAGFAPGIAAPEERAALLEARRRGVAVVQASRAFGGAVAQREALTRDAMVAAGPLNPQKARILLMLCLSAGLDDAALADCFQRGGASMAILS